MRCSLENVLTEFYSIIVFGDPNLVVFQEELGVLLADGFLGLVLGERGHFVEDERLLGALHVEGDGAAINDEIGHFFGHSERALHLAVLTLALAGVLGRFLDRREPLGRLKTKNKYQ